MRIRARYDDGLPAIEQVVVQHGVPGEQELLRGISLAVDEALEQVCEARGAFDDNFTSDRARRSRAAREFRSVIGLDALEQRWEDSTNIAESILAGRKVELREREAETDRAVETIFDGRAADVAHELVMRGIVLLCVEHGHDENILRGLIEYEPVRE